MTALTESDVEKPPSAGFGLPAGRSRMAPDVAPDAPGAERAGYGAVSYRTRCH